jgi:hypothetical protein
MMAGGYAFPGGVIIQKDGVQIGRQETLNLTDTGTTTITAVNNPALARVDINWDSSGVGTGDVVDLSVDFTFASASPIVVGALNPGDTILASKVAIDTPFDDPAATAQLGITGTPGLLLSTSDIPLTAASERGQEATYKALVATTVQLTLVPAASTAGGGRVNVLVRRA